MVDDWFVPLTVLACEREVTLALNQNDIVDRLAVQSAALKKHLLRVGQLSAAIVITLVLTVDSNLKLFCWAVVLPRIT